MLAEFTIPTASLDLVLKTPAEVLAWVASLPPEVRAEVSPAWIERVHHTLAGDPWALSFTTVVRATGTEVGGCSFKGPPDANGVVEIAYGTDPAHRGRGFATEAAAALTRFAFASGLVRRVRAHTKPDNAASARVLAKCGFRRVGDVIDPEDGLVCRWENGPAGTENAAPELVGL
jgi:RimJ/RimL family protein N-acetyltransferase